MRITTPLRLRIAAAVAALAVLASVVAVRAQFAPPTCVPPLCNPEVIQNIDVDTGTAQVADINITGDAKLGAKLRVGAVAPVLTQATENLYYGNVGGTSSNGSLLLLQMGGADRLRVLLTGQLQLPLGSAAAPSYSFLTDTNTGFYSSGADTIVAVTNGTARTTTNNSGFTLNSGALSSPTGSAAAPTYTFTGDTNTGMYRSAADTLNLATNGVSRLQIDASGLVTIPGSLTVQGTFTASGGLGGDGGAITNLNASNITTGTLNDARLSSNVALLDRATQTFTGNNAFTGMTSLGSEALVAGAGQNVLYGVADATSAGNLLLLQSEAGGVYTDRFRVSIAGAVTAASFAGSGASLTSLNASNLASGIVPSARISGTYSNNLTFSGMTSFGSAALAVGGGQNLLYGNVDTASTGNLLLLQNESVDRFRVDAAGNLTLSGTVNASGSLTSGGVNVCLQNGTNCPSSLGGSGSGSGSDGYISRFTGATTLGNSVIYQDGAGNVGIGTTSPSAKLSVNGNITAQGVSTYLVAGGATGVVGQVVGVGSTGVAGSGGSYGVYGSSGGYGVYGYNTSAGATGAGVYGYGTGTSPGIQGDSQSGWGGSFSSLYVTPGTAYFAGAVTLNGGATLGAGSGLTLGTNAGDIVGANGRMSYNTSTNKFRCYENGAWKNCTDGAVASVTGSGAGISVSPTTGAVVVQNTGVTSAVAGAGISVSGATGAVTIANTGDTNAADDITGLNAGAGISISGSAPTLTVTNTGVLTEADTLESVAARGRFTNTYISVNGAMASFDTGVASYGSGIGVSGQAGAGGTGVSGWGGAIGGQFTGTSYGIYAATGGSYGGYFSGGTYGVYSAGGNNYFAGSVGVGIGPSYALDVNGYARVASGIGAGGQAPSAGYGVRGQGTTMGGYFQDSTSGETSSYAYLGYFTYGGYFNSTNAQYSYNNIGVYAYGYYGYASYGVWANAGGGSVANYGLYVGSGTARVSCANLWVDRGSYIDCSDIAEVYDAGQDDLEQGDLVVWRQGEERKLYKSSAGGDETIAGVYSTSPGVLMGNEDVNGKYGVELGNDNTKKTIEKMKKDGKVPLALAGRAPVKVTLENGPIRPGDLLTASSTPGKAMRATETGRVVGVAMETFDGRDSDGKILVQINPHFWVNPDDYLNLKDEMDEMKAEIRKLKAERE